MLNKLQLVLIYASLNIMKYLSSGAGDTQGVTMRGHRGLFDGLVVRLLNKLQLVLIYAGLNIMKYSRVVNKMFFLS